ncbi:similar to Saccharomyces cerevisiae YOL070C NBA1 Protein of unknown function, localizes to the bud neck and cytoplasm [Maudiozyma barnettii]|uniref:Protein NBA1 n=1 Tax=Maudiozyma barnettii TaxID=61262 RepID=A0A8H2ZKQ6_9SACH|nr:Nba1p [Kazachstania barnettii]CAB4257208.1 similar to Saccharomyces cerevisiae YOL070C NBA1 Protein of unknown function, localizes to the bud neck and cytoplasm [Kazachstania barnettii]CAD1779578.1 similar to Saccharomyces cerevisiae YOL070C NBA1 Protein of unknown function, localizes to the bud neck and cytoplasm [Kazachstania barnettii]
MSGQVLERKTPSPNVSSTQRLSAMIDSLHNIQSNEDLLRLSNQQPKSEESLKAPNRNSLVPPSVSSFSPYQGSSSVSDYSGVISQAMEVVRVNNNEVNSVQPLNAHATISNLALSHNDIENIDVSSSSDSDGDKKPLLPNLPTEEDLRKTSYASRLPTFISERSETPVATITDSPGKSTMTSKGSGYNKSIPSHLNLEKEENYMTSDFISDNDDDDDVERTERELMSLNIRDPNHSHYKESSINDIDNTDIIDVSDHSSIASSIGESLNGDDVTPESKISVEQNGVNVSPVVPPRSKDRPRANRIPTEKRVIEAKQEEALRVQKPHPQSHKSLTSFQSTTNNSESYYSAASFLPEEDNLKMDDFSIHDPQQFTTMNKSGTMVKPPNHFSNEEIFGDTPSKIHTVDLDNIYEDIHPATLPPKKVTSNVIQISTKPQTKSSSKKDHKKNKKKTKELRDFNVETINELLNVTKGTLIGSEFSNLGMKMEEKRLLERLVDSLSRLTADMVLEPNRYDEGLRRINKATRALEGFVEK